MNKIIKHKLKIGLAVTLVLLSTNTAFAGISREEKSELKDKHQAYQADPSENLSQTLSLNDVLQQGASLNPSLKAAFYDWKASVHQIKQARSLEDPQFSFKMGIDHVETRLGPQEESYSISQHIPFPGKLYTKDQIATAESRQKYADYQKIRLEVFYELKNAFYEYWYLYKRILVTEKNMEFLKHFESVAQSKFKSGKAKNQDLLKAQVELGRLENDILTLNDYRLPLMANLNALMNRNITSEIGWPEDVDHEIIRIDENKIYELFIQNNPDLVKASERIEEADKRVRLARLDYLPDVTASFDYTRIGDGPLNVADNGRDATSVMFKVNVPLWLGKQKSQVDEAKAMQTASNSMKDNLQKELEAKLKMVVFRINDAERQIKLYRDALLPKAEQSLKSSETAYSGGEIDFLNLIDSERTLLEFQLGYYQAIRDYEQRLAQLEMMVGEDLRGENHGTNS